MAKKELIKKLLENGEIVIVGPDYSNKSKLRIYYNGGRIGRLYVGNIKTGKSELLDEGYTRYNKELEPFLKKNKTNEEIEKKLIDKNYFKCAREAFKKKWGDEKQKERNIETKIVKKFIKSETDWAIVDMEVQCPRKWFEGANFGKGVTKQPRFDMVVINEDGLGIIELKVDNKSCDNLNSHFKHLIYIQNHSKDFIDEMKRRFDYLYHNELISQKTYNMYKKMENNLKVWCGFLFVGENLEESKNKLNKCINKNHFNQSDINKIKFMYYENKEDFKNFDLKNTIFRI